MCRFRPSHPHHHQRSWHRYLPAFFVLLALSPRSWAGLAGATTTAPANTTGIEATEAAAKAGDCGQDCLYKTANENMTLQSVFTVFKVQILQDIAEGRRPGSLGEELGNYCLPSEGGSDCFARYKREAARYLPELQTAIRHNSQTIQDLGTATGTGDRSITRSRAESSAPPSPRAPILPTLEQIKTGYERTSPAEERAAIQRWASETSRRSAEPRPEDFIQTREVLVNGAKRSLPVKNPDGSFAIDQAAFQAAKKAYDDVHGDLGKQAYEADAVAAKHFAELQGKQPLAPRRILNVASPLPGTSHTSTDQEAFLAARGSFFQALGLNPTTGAPAGTTAPGASSVSIRGAAGGRTPAAGSSPSAPLTNEVLRLPPPPAGAPRTDQFIENPNAEMDQFLRRQLFHEAPSP